MRLRDSREIPHPFHHVRTLQVGNLQPGGGLLLESDHAGTRILDSPVSRRVRNTFVVCKLPNLWDFVVAALMY